ncbi:MAG: hypothetical protein K9W44_01725 [Candidatus Lokiarchaeota archaeon]|nr:hypothetical protein [Candidatus Harpocratesius repetitus]
MYRPIIRELLTLLSVYYNIKEDRKISLEDLVEMIKEVLIEQITLENADDSKEKLEKIKDFDTFLLNLYKSNDNIKLYEKARNLERERENLLMKSRIMTDIRPIFDDGEIGAFNRTIIMHTLKLELLNKNRRIEKLLIGLDHQDLIALKENIERAIEKEVKIREKCNNSDISIIGE